MTVRAFMDSADPLRIDLNNKIDPKNGVRYLGSAWFDLVTGRWMCLADVGALCVVEVRLIVSGEGIPSTSDPEQPTTLRLVETADDSADVTPID
jgi:hypothetical protein